jgi:hypothetical protein
MSALYVKELSKYKQRLCHALKTKNGFILLAACLIMQVKIIIIKTKSVAYLGHERVPRRATVPSSKKRTDKGGI